jgi:splicing suppressor protein 51
VVRRLTCLLSRALGSQTCSAEAPSHQETASRLQSCEYCNLTFFCSDSHRDFGMPFHRQEGSEGAADCHAYQFIRNDKNFNNLSRAWRPQLPSLAAMGSEAMFSWAPFRIMPAWRPLEGTTWDSEYRQLAIDQGPCPEFAISSFLRASTEWLTMPLTVLYGLEKLGHDGWQDKETLSIHVRLFGRVPDASLTLT